MATVDCGALLFQAIKCEVNGCIFQDFDNGGGILLNSAATGSVIVNNQIDNCSPIELGGSQYGSIHCNANNCLISGNRITDNDLTGISSAGADYLTITDNYIEGKTTGTTSGGILLDGNNVGCVISQNTVNGCKVEGIQIAGSIALHSTATMDHMVSNNVLLDCGYSAISLNGDQAGACKNITISGNQIKTSISTARAFEIIRLSDSTIIGNYVYGYAVGLNVVQASPNLNITGNTFENQDTTAIQVLGALWLVSGNRIVGDGSGGSTTGITFNADTTAGEQLITSNQIRNCLVGINGTFAAARTYVYANHFLDNGTDQSYTSNIINSSFGNCFDGGARSGTFTMNGTTTVTVSNTSLDADDKIHWSLQTIGGTPNAIYVSARNNGTSFAVKGEASDTSVYDYWFDR